MQCTMSHQLEAYLIELYYIYHIRLVAMHNWNGVLSKCVTNDHYLAGLLKLSAIRGGPRDVVLDERLAVGLDLMSASVPSMLRMLYPPLYAVHDRAGSWGRPQADGRYTYFSSSQRMCSFSSCLVHDMLKKRHVHCHLYYIPNCA